MFRKIDRWIGRHMDARRWTIVWMHVAVGGSGAAGAGAWWGWGVLLVGSVMAIGNLRRLS